MHISLIDIVISIALKSVKYDTSKLILCFYCLFREYVKVKIIGDALPKVNIY